MQHANYKEFLTRIWRSQTLTFWIQFQHLKPLFVTIKNNILVGDLCCLLALPIGKRPCIYAKFGLGDKILAHPLTNVEMTSVHRMKIFTWM
jgi:hypothetical protein